jgi:hypothetical protein
MTVGPDTAVVQRNTQGTCGHAGGCLSPGTVRSRLHLASGTERLSTLCGRHAAELCDAVLTAQRLGLLAGSSLSQTGCRP